LSSWLLYRFAFVFEQRLAERLLSGYLAQPYQFFLRENSALLTKNILTETVAVVGGVVIPGLQLITKFVVVVLTLTLLMFIDSVLALTVAVVLSGAYSFVYILIRRKLLENGQLSTEANAQIYKSANEALGAVKELKLLGKESAFVERFSQSSKLNAHYKTVGFTLSTLPRYAIESLAFGGMLLILLYLIGLKKDISHALPLIALYSFAGYRLLPAVQQIFHNFSTIRYNFSAFSTLKSDLDKHPLSSHHLGFSEVDEPMPFIDKIEISNLRFSYAEGEPSVFDSLSLTIQRNACVGFVGLTGAGKSTLIDIILGLLEPGSGGVFVDGQKVTQASIRSWQRNVGYVPQQIYLVDDTIEKNIAFGCAQESIDMPLVEDAARTANLHEYVTQELPNGYKTIVGERGVRLSGGQRQRIGIARSLYHKPKVLVLDEATSALDGITERVIIEAIQALSHKITIIMVAHRLTTVKDCDVIYLLDRGKVAQSGTFSELSASNETFKSMLNA
jgi:ABC-type multidrug transport system fused ATPase/permease subunit